MKGRRAASNATKILHGSRQPLNLHESHPGALSARLPPELVGDAVACGAWRKTIAPLIRANHVTMADREIALGFCLLWSAWRAQTAQAAVLPLTVPGVRPGTLRQHPARQAAHATYQQLIKTMIELGVTPASRGRVRVIAPLSAASPLDRFLRKAGRPDSA